VGLLWLVGILVLYLFTETRPSSVPFLLRFSPWWVWDGCGTWWWDSHNACERMVFEVGKL
jgi:hypothetical protein